MVFSSILFLLYFLPIFLLIYHAVKKRYKNTILLIFSIIFYSWGAPLFVFVVLLSTAIDYFIVREMYNSQNERRKFLLVLSISINLGLLVYFKYANFFMENVNFLFSNLGLSTLKWVEIALPIGISFYTFQTLTYSIDVYRNVHKPLDKLRDYLVYIMSFPQMIAGPIVRYSHIADQLENRNENYHDKLMGLCRFAIGLAKKVLIADPLGRQADFIFNLEMATLSSGDAWLGILAFTFQIYFDFSGYSDMAIGLGRILGFSFPENFNAPYISQSITEFWRRWHMTLGSFMKNYLYIPLGGNRVPKNRLYANLVFVFFLSGLWHGASWNFVIWGLYNGLFLLLDRVILIRALERAGVIFRALLTFVIVVFGWVIFRVDSLQELPLYLEKLLSFSNLFSVHYHYDFPLTFAIALICSFIPAIPSVQMLWTKLFGELSHDNRYHLIYSGSTVVLLLLCISSVVGSDFNPFIYFRF